MTMVASGWEVLCFIGDAALVAILYKGYRLWHEAATQVKSAPTVTCGSELDSLLKEHDGNIAYACVEGVVYPVGRVLRSQYKDDITGVVQTLVLEEHKSKRTQGFWSDVRKILRDTVNTVPFVLSLPKTATSNMFETEHQVHVVDPTSADLLLDNLTETHAHFEADSSNLFSRGVDRLFGDVTKGIQETEHMLPVGASLLGLGKVMVESSKIKLAPPKDRAHYILTTQSKSEVIRVMESKAFVYKVLMGLFGALGIAISVMLIRKLISQWKQQQNAAREQEALERARLERLRRRERSSGDTTHGSGAADSDASANPDLGNSCVICLTEERDIVLLNCGHICLCSDCAQALPLPRRCPICRGAVERMLPLYHS